MNFYKVIIVLLFLWGGSDAKAQVPDESYSKLDQWQLTLDMIKSKAQTLVTENNGLKTEFQQLTGQTQQLQRSIDDQHYQNEQMSSFLKERHGRTDEQLRIEQLKKTINAKRQKARDLDENLRILKKRLSQRQRAQMVLTGHSPSEKQLPTLRNQLEDENKKEVVLVNKLDDLKSGDDIQNLNAPLIDQQNKELRGQLVVLRLQRQEHERKFLDSSSARANETAYKSLQRRQEQLERNINAYEVQLQQLRESSLMALSWELKKKRLVHELVQTDAGNIQIRNKIKELHEDIDVLRGQVAQLERRVHDGQGQD